MQGCLSILMNIIKASGIVRKAVVKPHFSSSVVTKIFLVFNPLMHNVPKWSDTL